MNSRKTPMYAANAVTTYKWVYRIKVMYFEKHVVWRYIKEKFDSLSFRQILSVVRNFADCRKFLKWTNCVQQTFLFFFFFFCLLLILFFLFLCQKFRCTNCSDGRLRWLDRDGRRGRHWTCVRRGRSLRTDGQLAVHLCPIYSVNICLHSTVT